MVSSARGAGTPSAPATARNGQPTTPITTPAEKVGEPIAGTPAKSKPVVQSYLVVAGRHSRIGSARAEARALHLLKVPAVVEATSTGSYRVIIERCQTLARAEKVVESYENKGHRFTILAITH